MAVELATAYISLVPSTRDFAKTAMRDVGPQMEAGGRGIGNSLVAGIGKVLKVGAVAVGAAAVAGIGTALVKGFSRLNSLDQANAKLTGLGHSAETVETIMSNALASVRGTAFGMGEAATTAAGAVAAGIKPGADLERTLKAVADASTIAGTDMGSMGAIFNKVAASNKVQMDVINQLHDAGVPALALLADQMGVTAEEASKMASAGKIDFETFRAAMEAGMGGAALESGNTFSGAMDNVGAALGRIGANFMGPVFAALPPMLQAITAALGPVEKMAGGLGAKLGDVLVPAMEGFSKWLGTVDLSKIDLSKIVEMVTTFSPLSMIFKALKPLLPQISDLFFQIVDAVTPLAKAIGSSLIPIVEALIPVIAGIVGAVLPVVSTLVSALAPVLTALAPIFLQIVDAVLPLVDMVLPILTELLRIVMPIFSALLAAIMPLIEPILKLVAPLLELAMVILKPLIELFLMLMELVLAPMMTAFEKLLPPIMDVVAGIAESLMPVIEGITKYLGGLIDFIIGAFTGDWKRAWSGIIRIFTGLFESITGIVKGVINLVIDLINGAISGINNIAASVKEATGGAIDIRLGKIPRLANGALISSTRGGSIVNVGEGRYDEAVMPLGGPQLDKIRDALDGGSGDRPIYADGIGLIGWLRQIAGQEAQLIFNTQTQRLFAANAGVRR